MSKFTLQDVIHYQVGLLSPEKEALLLSARDSDEMVHQYFDQVEDASIVLRAIDDEPSDQVRVAAPDPRKSFIIPINYRKSTLKADTGDARSLVADSYVEPALSARTGTNGWEYAQNGWSFSVKEDGGVSYSIVANYVPYSFFRLEILSGDETNPVKLSEFLLPASMNPSKGVAGCTFPNDDFGLAAALQSKEAMKMLMVPATVHNRRDFPRDAIEELRGRCIDRWPSVVKNIDDYLKLGSD